MKTYKNEKITVKFTSEKDFTVTNIFGDTYRCELGENGNLIAKTAIALSYAIKAQRAFGF